MNASQSENRTISDTQVNYSRNRPAIGVIATERNSDAIVRTVVRAKHRGYPVLVTHHNEPSLDAITFARELGAQIVNPEPTQTTIPHLIQALSKNAHRLGFSGLLVHHKVEEYIDYERSISALENSDSYSLEAIVESTRKPHHTIAAIPAYNEEQTIETIVQRARHHVDEVLVVDDGSDDETSKRADDAGAIVLDHTRNRGYGATLKTIFQEASRRDTDHLVVLDGDGQHDPDDIPKLLTAQREAGAELVIGSRFVGDMTSEIPTYRAAGLWIVNVLTNISMGTVGRESRVYDTQSGFRAYNSEAIRTLALDESIGSGMDASTDILYHAANHEYHIEEVETKVRYDVEYGSKHSPLSHGFVLIRNILQRLEYKRPLPFLGLPGVGCFAFGLGLIYWMSTNYPEIGTFSVGVAFLSIIFGSFLILSSIIMYSLKIQEKYNVGEQERTIQ